jgi:hypothetical protein
MTNRDIIQLRLINQKLIGPSYAKPHELVSYMGCIQAQDFFGAKWAIGTRIKDITDALIEKEFDEGKIIRTHVLRPTWHFIAAGDVGWILELTAPRIKMLSAGYHRKEGIDSTTIKQSQKIFEDALTGGKQLSREELMPLLKNRKIKTSDNHLSFLLLEAELDGLICSGARKGKQFTYALLEERVPKLKYLHREEAVAELAKRYFISRGPATAHDFAWWSGLSLTDAKKGLELNKQELIHETINAETYWFSPTINSEQKYANEVHLLPAFDEFLIAYKNRTLSLKPGHSVITGNGIFKPTLMFNGRVTGTWKRANKKDKVLIEVSPFIKLSKLATQKTLSEANNYAKFLGKKTT